MKAEHKMRNGNNRSGLLVTVAAIALVLSFASLSSLHAQVDSTNGVPITFVFKHALLAGEMGVGLNGTFNNWGNYYNRHPYKMQNIGNDTWSITVPLTPDSAGIYIPPTGSGDDAPGVYEYKFVTYNISGGDTTIVGWFPDPLDARQNAANNNNSILHVTNPAIYNLSPLNGSTINIKTPVISARIAAAETGRLEVSSIELTINGVEVANSPSYFDSTTGLFSYPVSTPMTPGRYSMKLSAMSSDGFTGADSSTFTVSNAIVEAPYTFVFDPYSPNLKFLGDSITAVSVQGPFNFYGSDPLSGPDSEGVFKADEMLPVDQEVTNYQFIVRGASAVAGYVPDPDNPNLTSDYSPYVIKTINHDPKIEPSSPVQGKVFWSPAAPVNISAVITENDSGTAIDTNSIHVYYDGTGIPHSVDSVANGYSINSVVSSPSIGRHVVSFAGADADGNKAAVSYLTFGVYQPNTGYYYVDGENDDDGPGGYSYPSGVAPHAGDLHDIHITTNAAGDSLEFTVDMGAIDNYTRFALEITNKLEQQDYVDALPAVNLKVPEWNNRGVYMIIGAPNSSQLDTTDNVLFVSRDPLEKATAITVNPDAETSSQFRFAIPLSDIESVLGSYSGKWYFTGFTFFGSTGGAISVPPEQDNPYVYNVAFDGTAGIQHRLLSDYIGGFNIGAPRLAVIGTLGRGTAAITPSEISPALANRPYINILTDGGDWYEDTLRVYAEVSDSSITSADVRVTNNGFVHDTTVAVTSGLLSALLPLTDGVNRISVSVVKSGDTTTSKAVEFHYWADHSTDIIIKYSISGNSVTMDASSSINPDGLPVAYSWTPDPSNPAPVTLQGANTATASYTSPVTDGEYYFDVDAMTSLDTSWARAVVVVDSGQAHTVDLITWHPSWVDTMVVYEIYIRSLSLSGKMSAVTGRIPQLKTLGVNCIWLMPIYQSSQLSSDQPGYTVTNYYGVNPDYGTKADLTKLVNTAHQYGIKVILDMVINHTSALHPFMQDAFKYNGYSPYYSFYNWNSNGSYQTMPGWWNLPNINYETPWVRQYLLRMLKYWVENFNIDGYRFDVAWGINDDRASGPAFLQSMRAELKAVKPDIYLLGECDATGLQYFDGKFDSGYDWSLYGLMQSTINHISNVTSLDSLINWYRRPSYPSNILPFRFLENHDQARFISQFSVSQTKMAAALLYTLPGVPMVYAGQEVGETAQRSIIDWSDPNNLQPYYKSLIHIRDGNPALQQGTFMRLKTTAGDSVYAYLRMSGNDRVIVVNNFYSSEVNAVLSVPSDTLHLDSTKTWYANDVLNSTTQPVTAASLGSFGIKLAPYQSEIIELANSPLTAVDEKPVTPRRFRLLQNFPNPFNPTTIIEYEIPKQERVTLEIYDVLGQRVATLVDGMLQPGEYSAVWRGTNNEGVHVATGVYFYRLRAGDFLSVKKMLLLK